MLSTKFVSSTHCHRVLGLSSSAYRFYSTPPPSPTQVPIKLIAELRKLTEVSLSKAREALSSTQNDVQAALQWLERDAIASGAKKAAKLEGRDANEGLIGLSVLQRGSDGEKVGNVYRGAMVELNCETDFVARNELFGKLLGDIAHTTAYLAEHDPQSPSPYAPFPLELLLDAPLLSANGAQGYSADTTVSSGIRDLIGKVGEKISLRRAVSAVSPRIPFASTGTRLSCYAHGSAHLPSQGRIAALVTTNIQSTHLTTLLQTEQFLKNLGDLELALARQIVGFPTMSIADSQGLDPEQVLYTQQFLMYPAANGRLVREALDEWAHAQGLAESDPSALLDVQSFLKWTVGGEEVVSSL